jgi:hypothetical protein
VIPGNDVLIGPGVAISWAVGPAGEAVTVGDGDKELGGAGVAMTTSCRSEEDATHQSVAPPATAKAASSTGNGTFERAA